MRKTLFQALLLVSIFSTRLYSSGMIVYGSSYNLPPCEALCESCEGPCHLNGAPVFKHVRRVVNIALAQKPITNNHNSPNNRIAYHSGQVPKKEYNSTSRYNFNGGAVGGMDQSVINLALAIRKQESDNNYSIPKGKSGEIGAYQFTPDAWNSMAPKCGVFTSLERATPQQQDLVAYYQIKEWKNLGYTPKEIASMWNAGNGEPHAYTGWFHTTTKTHRAGTVSRGINRDGAYYNVAVYSERVEATYRKLKKKYPS